MDWGHARIQVQRSEKGAVNVMDCLDKTQILVMVGIQAGETSRTNRAAMSQLTPGSESIPFFWGRVNMMYSKVMNPGTSIVAHPIFPGILKRDW